MNSSNMGRKFVGMQCHPHDLTDEGTRTVLRNMLEKIGANAALLEVNTVGEHHPSPSGDLPHNPKRKQYDTEPGTTCFNPKADYYVRSKAKPVKTAAENIRNIDCLKDFCGEARNVGLKAIAWIQCLENPLLASRYPDCVMVDIDGRLNDHGRLCPNNPDVRNYVLGMIQNIVNEYPVEGVFLDRFRFPRPDEVRNIFLCFCRYCFQTAKEWGYNPYAFKDVVRVFSDSLRGLTAEDIRKFASLEYGFFDLLKRFVDFPDLLDWVRFRIETIRSFVKEMYDSVKMLNPQIQVGLDAQPPSYSWFLGQDYRYLRDFCDWIKPITYPKLRGQMIANILTGGTYVKRDEKKKFETFVSLKIDEIEPEALTIAYKLLGVKGPLSIEQARNGLPPRDYLKVETLRARQEAGPNRPIYMGQQIWHVSPKDVEEQVLAVRQAGADGVVYYSYGWAPFENFQAAKKAWDTD